MKIAFVILCAVATACASNLEKRDADPHSVHHPHSAYHPHLPHGHGKVHINRPVSGYSSHVFHKRSADAEPEPVADPSVYGPHLPYSYGYAPHYNTHGHGVSSVLVRQPGAVYQTHTYHKRSADAEPEPVADPSVYGPHLPYSYGYAPRYNTHGHGVSSVFVRQPGAVYQIHTHRKRSADADPEPEAHGTYHGSYKPHYSSYPYAHLPYSHNHHARIHKRSAEADPSVGYLGYSNLYRPHYYGHLYRPNHYYGSRYNW